MCMAIPPASAHSTPSRAACSKIMLAAFKPSSVVMSRRGTIATCRFRNSSSLIRLSLVLRLLLTALDVAIELGQINQQLLQFVLVIFLLQHGLATFQPFDLALKTHLFAVEFGQRRVAARLLLGKGIEEGDLGHVAVAGLGLLMARAVAVVFE